MGLKDGAIFRRACSVHLGVKDSCLRRTSSVLLFSLPNMKNVDRHFYLWGQFFSTSLWPRFLDNRWTLRHLSNSVIRLSVRYLTRIAQMDINMNILAKIKMFMTQFFKRLIHFSLNCAGILNFTLFRAFFIFKSVSSKRVTHANNFTLV